MESTTKRMFPMRIKLIAPLLALALQWPQSATADNVIASVGISNATTSKGAELELGYRFIRGRFSLNALPLGGIVSTRTPVGFSEEQFASGEKVCRNESTGQFTDKSKCTKVEFEYAGSATLEYQMAPQFYMGVGVRAGDETTAFGESRVQLGDWVFVRGRVGKDYLSGAISLGY